MPVEPTTNLTSTNGHVPDIESRIRVVKERERCIRHSLYFNSIPRLLLIQIVLVSIKMLNYFPTKGGVSTVYILKTILSVNTLHYKRHPDLNISQYCQVHEEDTQRNIQAARTKHAICLGPGGKS